MTIDPTAGTESGIAAAPAAPGHAPTAPQTAPSDPLRPGALFRGLTIHSVLGRGAMGTAYLASHPVLQVPHVIKTIHGTADVSIFREAHLGARVQSPHVVAVLDAGVEQGVAFSVQQYVDGIDLSELIEHFGGLGRPLPLSLVIRVVRDAARGLHALHQAGVVHCDIKPANLFLAASGGAMVGDFGIATDVRVSREPRGLSGTPLYMAPEQWAQRPLDRRADLYALGGSAHHLATGRPPFPATTAVGLAVAHTSDPYEPPPVRSPREAYFYAVLGRLLQKDPGDRYPSGAALSTDLGLIDEAPPRLDAVSSDRAHLGDLRIGLYVGDLAGHGADAVVSAANTALSMDVGVAAALRRAGGDAIAVEARGRSPAAMGDVVWTGAGQLRARHVAHAVAALGGAICVGRTTLRALIGAEARGLRRVAFPALGAGVGRVPPSLAAKLMLEAIATFAALRPQHVQNIDLVLFDEATRQIFRDVLHAM